MSGIKKQPVQKRFSTPHTPSEFRRRRKALGFGIRDLAAELGISVGHVSMMETGKRKIRLAFWLAIAQLEHIRSLETRTSKPQTRQL
jgi:transcriptional regulator with XRE-family HTH domain